jgi:hypothetical protein
VRQHLLREYVRQVLVEDDGGGGDFGFGGWSMGGGCFGAHFADHHQLYDAFVKPFTNIFNVASAEVQKLSTRAQALGRVAFETIVTTFIPLLEDSYDEIFADEKKQIEALESKYADTYKDVFDSFLDMDFMIPVFMFRPDLFLTAQLARKSPIVVAHAVNTATGGRFSNNRVMQYWMTPRSGDPNRFKAGRGMGGYGSGYGGSFGADMGGYGGGIGEGMIHERDAKKKQSPEEALAKFVESPDVKKAIASDAKSQRMAKAGTEVTYRTLRSAVSDAQKILSTKTLDDIIRLTGKRPPDAEKLKKLPDEERKVAEQKIVQALHASAKQFCSFPLRKRLEGYKAAGVPEGHPFVKAYEKAIAKIQSM